MENKLLEQVKDEYVKSNHPDYKDWDQFISDQPIYRREDHYDEIATAFAAKQNKSLLDWKESAKKVMNDLDLQKIGKEIGLKLGEYIPSKVLPWIREAKYHLQESADTIGRLKRSMIVHPDCEAGSEFDGYASRAQEMEDVIGKFLKKGK